MKYCVAFSQGESVKLLILRLGFLASACALTMSAGSITVGVYNTATVFPFGFPVEGPGTRYQEAYSSSLFSGPISITGIDFFLAPGHPNTLYNATFTLSLSTITAGVNDLSDTNFNGNLGADNTQFASVSLSGISGPELSFTTDTPFLYNPADGENLLLDIQITNINGTGDAGFEDDGPDGPSTIARYQNFGTGTSGFGLVTEFDYAPEPASFGLLAAGVGGMMMFANRRKLNGLNRRCRDLHRAWFL
jgi:hypothetical protein